MLVLTHVLSYVYNDAEGSFRDIDITDLPRENNNPPDNCPVHLRAEQLVEHNAVTQVPGGVTYHGDCFHAGDYVLVKSEKGPAHVALILQIEISPRARDRGKTDCIVRMLGRISDIAHLSPVHILRDEV